MTHQPTGIPEQVPSTRSSSDSPGPEIVVGLIGPLGVNLEILFSELSAAFASVSYRAILISLIEPVLEYPRWKNTPSTPFTRRYDGRMNAGNEFREELKRKDALALLAMTAIQKHRLDFQKREYGKTELPGSPIPRCAYVLRSLKTPDEVATLREIYGPNFVTVGAYMPRELRRQALMRKVAESLGDPETRRHEADASRLLSRDEFEFDEYGQNMRETFPFADIFVDVSNPTSLAADVRRFVEILFGHPTHTPRRVEAAMFHAYGAKLSSSSAGRQVGAAIVSQDGDLLAVGTNEVAKAHGGQYWGDEETYDERDHQRSSDFTSSMVTSILSDLLIRLQRKGWLSEERSLLDAEALRSLAKDDLLRKLKKSELRPEDPPTLGDKALLEKVIEYMRPLHAEMAALTTCARRGISVRDCVMYVTTFPCHECARLIVASGIRTVYFIEPYPKSRVAEMYDDSIAVDQAGDAKHIAFRAFVGIAPSRFVELFDAPEPAGRRPQAEVRRREADGTWVRWELVKSTRWPRRTDSPLAIMTREQNVLAQFDQIIASSTLRPSQETADVKQELGR